MAKRKAKKQPQPVDDGADKVPKSMVLALGPALKNKALYQLVRDVRMVMLPHTAVNLRERKANKLKDFMVMAGPLGVSDLMVFKQSETTGNVSLRLGKMPRGPSLQFKVMAYSLMHDVRRLLRNPVSASKGLAFYKQPPLLVMNGFTGGGKKMADLPNHEKLLITMLQNLFPPIQPQTTRVGSIKRVLVVNKNPDDELQLRHFAISTKMVEELRNIKKLLQSQVNRRKRLPIMTNHKDISELVLDPYSVGGLTLDSEVEDDAVVLISGPEAHGPRTRKRAIKLRELGPRIDMKLVKIEEAMVGSSKTVYHSRISKLKEEVQELDKRHQHKMQQKAERREAQKANVEAKKKKKKKVTISEPGAGDVADNVAADDDDADALNASDYENDSDIFSD